MEFLLITHPIIKPITYFMKTIFSSVTVLMVSTILSCSSSAEQKKDQPNNDSLISKPVKSDNELPSKTLIIDDKLFNDSSSNNQCGLIQQITIQNDSLKINVLYSGCSMGIDFKLVTDGMFTEESPSSIKLKLVCKEEGSCEPAYFADLAFDISNLKKHVSLNKNKVLRILIRDKVVEYKL